MVTHQIRTPQYIYELSTPQAEISFHARSFLPYIVHLYVQFSIRI